MPCKAQEYSGYLTCRFDGDALHLRTFWNAEVHELTDAVMLTKRIRSCIDLWLLYRLTGGQGLNTVRFQALRHRGCANELHRSKYLANVDGHQCVVHFNTHSV